MDTEIETADDAAIEIEDGQSAEEQARVQGWVPQDEWDGPADKWVDAETFVEKGRERNSVLRNENDALRRELREFRGELKRKFATLEAAERRGYETALAEMESRRLQAVEDGDIASFAQIDRELDKMKKDVAPAGDLAKRAEDAYLDFRESNTWYDRANLASASETEQEARLFADRLADRWVKDGRHKMLEPEDFYTEIAAETKKKFPALGLRKKAASDVSAPTGNRGPRGNTFADLPAEAKAMADKLVSRGILKSRAEYVKTYDWS
jgi:hypothetical protein